LYRAGLLHNTLCLVGVVKFRGLVWFGLVWFGLVWFGLVWVGLVWFGLVWFGLFSIFLKIMSHVCFTCEGVLG
jgi:hypothetical protein